MLLFGRHARLRRCCNHGSDNDLRRGFCNCKCLLTAAFRRPVLFGILVKLFDHAVKLLVGNGRRRYHQGSHLWGRRITAIVEVNEATMPPLPVVEDRLLAHTIRTLFRTSTLALRIPRIK